MESHLRLLSADGTLRDVAVLLLGIYAEKTEALTWKGLHPHVHQRVICSRQDMETPQHLSVGERRERMAHCARTRALAHKHMLAHTHTQEHP